MEKERERKFHVWLPLAHPLLGTWPVTQASALTGNRTSDPLVCRPVFNPLSHTSQSNTTAKFLEKNQFVNIFSFPTSIAYLYLIL